MAVELRPLGVACNIRCRYCYQNPQRDAGNTRQTYDLERMRAAVEREGGPFTLFGGEALMLPLDALEDLFRWGFEKYGRSGLQTNGLLINDEHLRLFRQYNVDVGISIDGPGEHNDLRWNGSAERTRRSTEQIEANIARVCREHRPPGLIITLHRLNAAAEKLPRMFEWMRELDAIGIRSVRLHALEVDSPAMRAYTLSDEENARAFLGFAELQRELKNLKFDVLGEIERSLMGHDKETSCVWRACDQYTTEAVRGVEGNGQSSNCGRTNKDGVDFLKADTRGYERYLALWQTPQEDGGCKDCRFFLMCRGQCPGTAIDGDWRNRSELCGLWKRLFTQAEKSLVLANQVPLTLQPVRHRMERHLARLWKSGRNSSIHDLPRTELPSPVNDGFTLPPFVRRAYAGEAQRAVWQPRIEAVLAALPRIALAGVGREAIPAAVVTIDAAALSDLRKDAARRGLLVRVLATTGALRESRIIVIGTRAAASAVEDAWNAGDFDAVDAALAIPSCCRTAARLRRNAGTLDPVWSATKASSNIAEVVAASPATNILLRSIGIDLLGYAPCAFDCEESGARGEALLESARTEQIEAAEWLEDILGWPVEWSALHGIAEVKTAIVKIAYATDYTPSKVTVRRHGVALPAGAARGLSFAYQEVRA